MNPTEEYSMPDATVLSVRVTKLFREQLDLVIDDPAMDLFGTGLLDSLGFVTLLQAIEEEFGMTISVDDLEIPSFSSVNAIVEFLVSDAKAKAPLRTESAD